MKRALRITALALVTFALGGCVVGAPEIAHEVDIVQWDMRPADVVESAEFHFGRGMLGMASAVARWSDDHDAEFAAELLDGIEAVHIGVYEIDRTRDTPWDLTGNARDELEDLGWRLLVRTREYRDETTWVFARIDGPTTEMLVVALEDDEIAVVRVDGDAPYLMQAAIRRDRDFDQVAYGLRHEF